MRDCSLNEERTKMKNKLWKILVAAGGLMILSALVLCVSNILESRRAGRYSAEALEIIKENIPEPPETTSAADDGDGDLFAEYERQTGEPVNSKVMEIDGYRYIGYIAIETLGLELPVMEEFSYTGLKRSPCRYSGSPETDDFIIAAHNYSSHFGRLDELAPGDSLVFTGADGKKYRYKVLDVELLDGSDGKKLLSGAGEQWDLTLFSCNLSGRSRVTVRAEYAGDESNTMKR